MPDTLLAVNLATYGRHREGAYAHLERVGVRHVEIGIPAADSVASVQKRLSDHGLSATSLQCPCDLAQDAGAMRPHLEVGRRMGVSLFFVSAKAGDLSKPEAYRRLRERAELADEYGVTLALETHPDLGENATEARATIHAVGHPRLRWNMDTANLYYYNHGADAVEQARRGAEQIASVHLKDTNGAYGCWWFPALGKGVVDFAGVYQVLGERDFRGPYTIEIEGVQGETLDEAATHARLEKSLAHLRSVGLL